MDLGRNVVVSDQLTSSLLVAQARIALARTGIGRADRDMLLAEVAFDHECRSSLPGRNGEGTSPELFDWYSADTMSQLRYLWAIIEKMSGETRSILLGMFSDILFQCASTGGALTSGGKKRRHHWGWIADNVKPAAPLDHDVVGMFRQWIARSALLRPTTKGTSTSCLRGDARRSDLKSSSVDLIVTSPPYVGMIDYTHASRMLYLWMNWSLEEDRASEIGARYRRRRQHLRTEYLDDMGRSASEMHRVLKPGCYCAVVLGESRALAGTAPAALNMISDLMPVVWGPVPRLPSRRRVSDRRATDQVEYVAVFEKR